ncbi:MAG: hypothetical protein HQL45_15680 [Alphaproteobacteria bacterium]|nr:hypothetical protein [Alphaproteobacteria bacterium]
MSKAKRIIRPGTKAHENWKKATIATRRQMGIQESELGRGLDTQIVIKGSRKPLRLSIKKQKGKRK